jgi:tetratricopeptide (TPR) repeat protein
MLTYSVIIYLSTAFFAEAQLCVDVDDCLGKASLKLASNNAEERHDAFQLYKEATQLDPDSKDAWLGLGGCQKDTGRLGHALYSFSIALALDPLCWRVGLNIASVLAMKSNFTFAERAYKHVIRTHPYHPQAYYSIGFIYLHQVSDSCFVPMPPARL